MGLFDDISRLPALDTFERRVFLHADLDAPCSSFGGVLDDTRLRAVLPTLRYLLEKRARIVVGAHYGSAAEPADESAVQGVARRLSELLGSDVSVLGERFHVDLARLEPGRVALTPNLLDTPREAGNDARFAYEIARCIDAYVGDDVRAAARAWTSPAAVPRLVATRGAGFVLGSDLDILELFASPTPVRPYVAVIGGDSFRRKSRLLWSQLQRADAMLLGGVVANTCLKARGVALGQSAYEPAELDAARAFMTAAQARGVSLHLPRDVLVSRGASLEVERRDVHTIAADEAVVDVALETCLEYQHEVSNAGTVVWNGLLGTCDRDETRSGTYRAVQFAPTSARHRVVFGARTVAMSELLALTASFTHVSRSGEGAHALMAGSVLPGVESLRSLP